MKPAAPGRAYGGLLPEQRRAQREQALVQAAVRVFGTVGYHAATVKAICREAGLTDRYFYESFESTEALLCAAYRQVAGELLALLRRAVARHPAAVDEAITACLAAYFRFMRKPQAARVLLMEVLGVSPAVDALYQRTNVEFAKAIVAPWLAQAELRAGADPRVLAIALTGAVTSAATLWLLSGHRPPAPRMVASCRQVIVGTLQHLGAPAG